MCLMGSAQLVIGYLYKSSERGPGIARMKPLKTVSSSTVNEQHAQLK